MIDIQNARVNTAGAYICIDGYYVFAIGIRPYNGHIPIVRLGGHREEQETGWQCAVREVYEESNLHITPLLPPTTYLCNWDQIDTELQEIQWQPKVKGEPIPKLVVTYRREDKMHLSLMYLAHAEGVPKPSSEVKGLLFLREEEVHRLCQGPLTLEQYLNTGGKAILNAEFDTSLILEPFAQLRLLSRILSTLSLTTIAHTAVPGAGDGA
jgi:8-oxo-dGTP pyrophosphatase MutT (NUDIX family)